MATYSSNAAYFAAHPSQSISHPTQQTTNNNSNNNQSRNQQAIASGKAGTFYQGVNGLGATGNEGAQVINATGSGGNITKISSNTPSVVLDQSVNTFSTKGEDVNNNINPEGNMGFSNNSLQLNSSQLFLNGTPPKNSLQKDDGLKTTKVAIPVESSTLPSNFDRIANNYLGQQQVQKFLDYGTQARNAVLSPASNFLKQKGEDVAYSATKQTDITRRAILNAAATGLGLASGSLKKANEQPARTIAEVAIGLGVGGLLETAAPAVLEGGATTFNKIVSTSADAALKVGGGVLGTVYVASSTPEKLGSDFPLVGSIAAGATFAANNPSSFAYASARDIPSGFYDSTLTPEQKAFIDTGRGSKPIPAGSVPKSTSVFTVRADESGVPIYETASSIAKNALTQPFRDLTEFSVAKSTGSVPSSTSYSYSAFGMDKAGAVFRGGRTSQGGVRISPKSSTQLSKESRGQVFNPNQYYNQGEIGVKISTSNTGVKSREFLRVLQKGSFELGQRSPAKNLGVPGQSYEKGLNIDTSNREITLFERTTFQTDRQAFGKQTSPFQGKLDKINNIPNDSLAGKYVLQMQGTQAFNNAQGIKRISSEKSNPYYDTIKSEVGVVSVSNKVPSASEYLNRNSRVSSNPRQRVIDELKKKAYAKRYSNLPVPQNHRYLVPQGDLYVDYGGGVGYVKQGQSTGTNSIFDNYYAKSSQSGLDSTAISANRFTSVSNGVYKNNALASSRFSEANTGTRSSQISSNRFDSSLRSEASSKYKTNTINRNIAGTRSTQIRAQVYAQKPMTAQIAAQQQAHDFAPITIQINDNPPPPIVTTSGGSRPPPPPFVPSNYNPKPPKPTDYTPPPYIPSRSDYNPRGDDFLRGFALPGGGFVGGGKSSKGFKDKFKGKYVSSLSARFAGQTRGTGSKISTGTVKRKASGYTGLENRR